MKSFLSLFLLVSFAAAQSAVPTAPNVQAGKGAVRALTIPSKIYGRDRKVWIYTPAGYQANAATPYRALYCFDGDDYVNELAAPATLDELISTGKIPPLVAVFVDTSENRLADLANSRKFADFMANELAPWARSQVKVASDPAQTIVGGYSAGGLAASYVAFHHPEVFGNVLSQSGAYWRGNEGASQPYEWLTSQVAANPKKNLRFYVEVGAEEKQLALGSGPVFIEANRRFRDALLAKKYPVQYLEVPGAHHEPTHWRAQFGPALVALLSAK